jgi:hypothetical protein
MCFRSGCKCGCLFVAHVDPSNLLLSSNRIRDSIEGVTGDSVDSFHACGRKHLHKQIRHGFPSHGTASFFPTLLCTLTFAYSDDPIAGQAAFEFPSITLASSE